jgi:hypothetical protein
MALHESVQNLLLIGHRPPLPPSPRTAPPPAALRELVEALRPEHRAANERAIAYGHHWRSAFWALYLLSVAAVLLAVLPIALDWDAPAHPLHRLAPLWGLAELAIIGTVGGTYAVGHRRDWQGRWLSARTQAELVWYLPLAAALLDWQAAPRPGHWYTRLLGPLGAEVEDPGIEALCERLDARARQGLHGAWDEPAFVKGFGDWLLAIIDGQRHYHQRIAARHHALQHRVHTLNTWLFGLTTAGTAVHLAWHAKWLLVVSTVFPALGASLHGALAQSESFRLEASSERLNEQFQRLAGEIAHVGNDPIELRRLGTETLRLLLGEHQDWHMLVRPHQLPLG